MKITKKNAIEILAIKKEMENMFENSNLFSEKELSSLFDAGGWAELFVGSHIPNFKKSSNKRYDVDQTENKFSNSKRGNIKTHMVNEDETLHSNFKFGVTITGLRKFEVWHPEKVEEYDTCDYYFCVINLPNEFDPKSFFPFLFEILGKKIKTHFRDKILARNKEKYPDQYCSTISSKRLEELGAIKVNWDVQDQEKVDLLIKFMEYIYKLASLSNVTPAQLIYNRRAYDLFAGCSLLLHNSDTILNIKLNTANAGTDLFITNHDGTWFELEHKSYSKKNINKSLLEIAFSSMTLKKAMGFVHKSWGLLVSEREEGHYRIGTPKYWNPSLTSEITKKIVAVASKTPKAKKRRAVKIPFSGYEEINNKFTQQETRMITNWM